MRAALVLGIFLTACGGGPQGPSVAPASPRSSLPVSNAAPASSERPAPPAQGTEAAIVKMQQLSDAMCTCADKPCSERVTEEMTQWGRAMAGSMDKVTEDQAKQLTAISEHMTQCLRKLSPASGGSSQAAPPPVGPSIAQAPSNDAAPAAPGAAAALAQMRQFADTMCSCPDRACCDRVVEQVVDWGNQQKHSAQRDEPVSAKDAAQLASITKRMTGCMTAIMQRSAGPATRF